MHNKKRIRNSAVFIIGILLLIFYAPAVSAVEYSQNVIPTGGTPYASNDNSVIRTSAAAFDGTPYTFWTGWGAMPTEIGYTFNSPKKITKIHLLATTDPNNEYFCLPEHYEFQAYNQTTNQWDILKTVIYGDHWDQTFTFDNDQFYTKYRIVIYRWQEDSDWGIGEIEMFETISTNITSDLNNSSASYSRYLEFSQPKILKSIQFSLNNIDTASLPSSYNIEGFNETTGQWVSIPATGSITYSNNELTLNNNSPYKKYRINLIFNTPSAVDIRITAVHGL